MDCRACQGSRLKHELPLGVGVRLSWNVLTPNQYLILLQYSSLKGRQLVLRTNTHAQTYNYLVIRPQAKARDASRCTRQLGGITCALLKQKWWGVSSPRVDGTAHSRHLWFFDEA